MALTVCPIKVQFGLMINYSYLVYNSNYSDALLVDPAWQLDKIETALKQRHLTLKNILLTHAHHDHVNLVEPLVNRHKCRVWISDTEAQVSGFRCANLQVLTTEYSLHLGELLVRPIFTPGHTLGSTCYMIGDNLFTGDTLFIEGCGMCFRSHPQPGLLFQSLMRLKHLLANKTKIYPGHSYGHSPGKTFEFVLKKNVYLHFKHEEDFIYFTILLLSILGLGATEFQSTFYFARDLFTQFDQYGFNF